MRWAMFCGGAVVIGTCMTAAFGSAQGVARTAGTDGAGDVTATGCLTLRAASGVGNEQYVLARTLLPPDSTAAGSRDTGASGSPGHGSITPPTPPNPPSSSPGNATSSGVTGRGIDGGQYLVTGVGKETLRKHLNQQVELRGTLEIAPAVGMTGVGSSPASGGTSTSNLPKLNASSIRMVSASCKPSGSQQ